MGTELVQTRFEARVDDIEHVYDGDTINHVQFRLPDIEVLKGGHLGEVYPDIFSQQDGVWIHVNVAGSMQVPLHLPRLSARNKYRRPGTRHHWMPALHLT